MPMNNFDLSAMLKRYRTDHGFSMREIAGKLHMSKSAYGRLEQGITEPSYDEIQRILTKLGLKSDGISQTKMSGRRISTITYVKRGLLYGSISTMEALNCIKDLAEAIQCRPLLEWAEKETDGYWRYPSQPSDYRLYEAGFDIEYEQDSGKFFMSIPPEFINSIEWLGIFNYPHPIDDIDEKWVNPRGKIIIIHERIQPSLELILQKVYGPGFKLLRVGGRLVPQSLRKILLAVQEIMLRFLLCIETEFGQNVSIDELSEHKYQLGMLFQKVLESVGNARHLDLPVKPKIEEELTLIKGDEDRFCDWLDQHEISLYEQDEFFVVRDALKLTPPPDGIVPPEMCAWAKKVSSSNWRFREDEGKLLKGLKIFYGVKV